MLILLKSIKFQALNKFKKGLERKQRQDYTGEFKLNLLTYMKTTGASYSMTTNHFGISCIGIIANWNTKFLGDGVEAFIRPKRRPQHPMTKVLTREQQLEDENKLLRIESIAGFIPLILIRN